MRLNKRQSKFVLAGLVIILIRVSWDVQLEEIQGMAWVYLIILVLILSPGFFKVLEENIRIRSLRDYQKKLKDSAKRNIKGNAGLDVKNKFP